MHLVGFYYKNLLKLSVILRCSFNYRRSIVEVLSMNRQCNSLSLRVVVSRTYLLTVPACKVDQPDNAYTSVNSTHVSIFPLLLPE